LDVDQRGPDWFQRSMILILACAELRPLRWVDWVMRTVELPS
jgi:hypothetical protein